MTALRIDVITNYLAHSDWDFQLHYAPGRVIYHGHLQAADAPLPIALELRDGELIRLPKIRLLEPTALLKFGSAHIESDGSICYASPGNQFLDRAYPGQCVATCLQLAQNTIDSVLNGRPVSELTGEFPAYWLGKPVYIDLPLPNQSSRASLTSIGRGTQRTRVVTPTPVEARKYSEATGAAPDNVFVWFSQSDQPAYPMGDQWPVDTFHHFIDWLKQCQPAELGQLHRAVTETLKANTQQLLFIVQSPDNWYGAFCLLSRHSKTFSSPEKYAGALLKQSHVTRLVKFERISPTRVDHQFIASRNLMNHTQSLIGKTITLIGCGAIGGYLATSLVRIGAGLGGGRLNLVDGDTLGPGNLGRHILGFNALDQNKARAMEEYLSQQFKGLSITAFPSRIESVSSHLLNADIVIDASGVEAVSEWLSEQYLAGRSAPVLYCWIVGHGLRMIAYLQDAPDQACFRCFRPAEPGRPSLFLPDDYEIEESTAGGCDGLFVPFSNSSPLIAAALATELCLDWANGVESSKLRIYNSESARLDTFANHTPVPSSGCPACQHAR